MKTPEQFLEDNGITKIVIENGGLSMRNLTMLIKLRDLDHEFKQLTSGLSI